MLLISTQQDQRGGERGNYLEKLPLQRRHIQRVAFGTYVEQQPESRETAVPLSQLPACCIGSHGGATVSLEGWIGGHLEHSTTQDARCRIEIQNIFRFEKYAPFARHV